MWSLANTSLDNDEIPEGKQDAKGRRKKTERRRERRAQTPASAATDPSRRVLVAVERMSISAGASSAENKPTRRVVIRIEGGDQRDVEVIARMMILGTMMVKTTGRVRVGRDQEQRQQQQQGEEGEEVHEPESQQQKHEQRHSKIAYLNPWGQAPRRTTSTSSPLKLPAIGR